VPKPHLPFSCSTALLLVTYGPACGTAFEVSAARLYCPQPGLRDILGPATRLGRIERHAVSKHGRDWERSIPVPDGRQWTPGCLLGTSCGRPTVGNVQVRRMKVTCTSREADADAAPYSCLETSCDVGIRSIVGS